eukprot:3416517-Prymnesium_polylepis.1
MALRLSIATIGSARTLRVESLRVDTAVVRESGGTFSSAAARKLDPRSPLAYKVIHAHGGGFGEGGRPPPREVGIVA